MSPEAVEATNQSLDVEGHSILMVAILSKEGATSETLVGGYAPLAWRPRVPSPPPIHCRPLSQKGTADGGEGPVKD